MESFTRPLSIEEPPAKPKVIYVVYTKAALVEARGPAPDTSWWVRFDGSWESLYFGGDKPFEEGALIKITFEEVIQDAPTNSNPR